MNSDHIVVIGASVGGISALKKIVSLLPANFSAPLFVVMHMQTTMTSYLPELVNQYSNLPARHPLDGEVFLPGNIYIAPPNYHMILSGNKIYLRYGPKINLFRPSINSLFYSAANYGQATVAVLLSGLLNDGVAGLFAIKKNQGIVITQDVYEAEYSELPKNALRHVAMDYCCPTKEIAAILVSLVLDN